MCSNLTDLEQQKKAANFWQVSTEFYQLKGVEALLLELQHVDLLNVNEILFALWMGHQEMAKLGENDCKPIKRATRLAKSAVEQVRGLRMELVAGLKKPYPKVIAEPRNALLESELALEKYHQRRLVEAAFERPLQRCPEDDKQQLATHNLEVFAGLDPNHRQSGPLLSLWQGFLGSNGQLG